jgi:hypothetical protein
MLNGLFRTVFEQMEVVFPKTEDKTIQGIRDGGGNQHQCGFGIESRGGRSVAERLRSGYAGAHPRRQYGPKDERKDCAMEHLKLLASCEFIRLSESVAEHRLRHTRA